MSTAHEKWLDLVISSNKLLVADNWNLKEACIVEQCPIHAEVELVFLENLNHKFVIAVLVKGWHASESNSSEVISVDSGWLLVGDSETFESGFTPDELERKIEEGFDRVGNKSPLVVPIPNKKGESCGFVIATGLGDGRYELKQTCDDEKWKLLVEFL